MLLVERVLPALLFASLVCEAGVWPPRVVASLPGTCGALPLEGKQALAGFHLAFLGWMQEAELPGQCRRRGCVRLPRTLL